MRLAHIIGALGVAVCLTAVVPVTAEANSTSPYVRMDKVRHNSMMYRHHRRMHRHHHHRMMRHHMHRM